MLHYGEKIARLRKSKGMTQEDLGKILNVTYQAVSKWERGESLPDFHTMSQIAKYFEVPLDYFEEGNDDNATATPTPPPAPTSAPDEAAATPAPEAMPTATPTATPTPAPKESTAAINNIAGICTVCGKMLKKSEVYSTTPKIICRSCTARIKIEEEKTRRKVEKEKKAQQTNKVLQQLGSTYDKKLTISLIVAAVSFIATIWLSFSLLEITNEASTIAALLSSVVPPVVLAAALVVCDTVDGLRNENEYKGYTLKISLIIPAIFAAVDLFIVLFLFMVTGKAIVWGVWALGTVISYTFLSQFLWGNVIKTIFTCGGFTFRLPFFIITLSLESIIWMIVTKILLGLLSALIFIITTVLVGAVAVVVSVFTFIPCLVSKIRKDNAARMGYKF